MYEAKEVVNMVATIAFFIYFLLLCRRGKCEHIPKIWLMGVFIITIVNVVSVLEGFFLFNFFNTSEHILYTVACLCFLAGTISIKPESSAY